MPITDFECAIAKSQIGRYVAGDQFSDEAVQQLEAHIAACPSCKAIIVQRRRELMSMLGGDEASGDSSVAVSQITQPKPQAGPTLQPTYATQAVISVSQEEHESEALRAELVGASAHQAVSFMSSLSDDSIDRLISLRNNMTESQQAEVMQQPSAPTISESAAPTASAASGSSATTMPSARPLLPKFSLPTFKLPQFGGAPKAIDVQGASAPAPLPTQDPQIEVGQKPTNQQLMMRPMLFGIGLATVVGIMGMIIKPPTSLLGPKALASNANPSASPVQPVTAAPEKKAAATKIATSNPADENPGSDIQDDEKPAIAKKPPTKVVGNASEKIVTKDLSKVKVNTKDNPRAEAWRRLRNGESISDLKLPGVNTPAKKAAIVRHDVAVAQAAKIAKAAKAAKAAKLAKAAIAAKAAKAAKTAHALKPLVPAKPKAMPVKAKRKLIKRKTHKKRTPGAVKVYDETGTPIR